jgi:hypothetical protein
MMGPKLDCSEPHHRNAEMLGENRVEFGDSARPGVQVIAGDAIDHRVVLKLFWEGFILPDAVIRGNRAGQSSCTGPTQLVHAA